LLGGESGLLRKCNPKVLHRRMLAHNVRMVKLDLRARSLEVSRLQYDLSDSAPMGSPNFAGPARG